MLIIGLVSTKLQPISKKLRLFSLGIRHISRSLTAKPDSIWILHSKEKIKSNILAYFFDEKMQWKYQIRNIAQKVNLKLSKIKSIASFLIPHTKKLLVDALVMPHFHYCSPAWSNAASFRLNKIDKKSS